MLASKYNLTMDRFYFARGRNLAFQQQINGFAQGDFDYQSIYFIAPELMSQLSPQVLNYCHKIDGYVVCFKD